MKAFNEIQKDIEKAYQTIKENNKKIDELVNTYSNIMDFKEKILLLTLATVEKQDHSKKAYIYNIE